MACSIEKYVKFSIKSGFSTENCKRLWNDKPCEKYADFYFVFKQNGVEKRLPCHKAILASSSKVFDTMFDSRWNGKNEEEIKDVSYDVFVEFLQFFYLPDVTLTVGNLKFVAYLTHKYEVKECLKICEESLIKQSTLREICSELDLALNFDLDELKVHCFKTISDETKTVLTSEGFLSCSKDALKSILELDYMVDFEEFGLVLFDACVKWAKHACEEKGKDSTDMENWKNVLGDCWYIIPFAEMDRKHIADCVKKYPGLFNQDEMVDLFSIMASNDYPMKIFKATASRLERASKCFPDLHSETLYRHIEDGGEYSFNQLPIHWLGRYKLTRSAIDLIKEKFSTYSLDTLKCTSCWLILADYNDS